MKKWTFKAVLDWEAPIEAESKEEAEMIAYGILQDSVGSMDIIIEEYEEMVQLGAD